jgi:O-antigen/teichoic acid export membrane protein
LAIQGSLVFSGVLSARLLGPDLRGNLALATLLPGVVGWVASLSLANAIVYFSARDRAAAPNLLATTLPVATLLTVLAGLVHALLFWILFGGDDPDIRTAALPTLLVAPALVVQLLATAHLQGVARYDAMNALRVAPYVLYGLGVTACYLFGIRSLNLVVWSYVIAYGIVAIVSVAIIRGVVGMVDHTTSVPPRRTILGFGARGFAVSLSPIESFRADQLLVGAMLPAASLGYYSVAWAFSVLPRLMTQSLSLIASAEVAGGGDVHRRTSARGFLITAIVLLVPTVVGVELLLPLLIRTLFGEEFLPALTCSRLLLLAVAALGLRRFVTDLVRGLGQPTVESTAEVSSWPILAVGGILTIGAGAFGGGIDAVAGVILVASTVSLIVSLAYFIRAVRPHHLSVV